MNIKQKILELPCYKMTNSVEGRIYTEEMREQCAEVAQKEMDALIAEIRALPVKHFDSSVYGSIDQDSVDEILDKWSTK